MLVSPIWFSATGALWESKQTIETNCVASGRASGQPSLEMHRAGLKDEGAGVSGYMLDKAARKQAGILD